MNTILDILGASVIGGLVVLTLMVSLNNTAETNRALSRNLSLQQCVGTIEELFLYDTATAGRGVPDSVCSIINADSDRFVFIGDETMDEVIDTIAYYTEYAGNDTLIRCRTGSGQIITLGEGKVQFRYYDTCGRVTISLPAIRSVDITLCLRDILESFGNRSRAFLQKRIHLRNIH
jgi:hypothetical protein